MGWLQRIRGHFDLNHIDACEVWLKQGEPQNRVPLLNPIPPRPQRNWPEPSPTKRPIEADITITDLGERLSVESDLPDKVDGDFWDAFVMHTIERELFDHAPT